LFKKTTQQSKSKKPCIYFAHVLPTLALHCNFSKLENMRGFCQHFTMTLVSHRKPEGKTKWFLLVHVIFLESSGSPPGTITEIGMR